jgi:hypothetical protein
MRVLMLAPGTHGDVAAPTGLGARLQAAGHGVTIVADAPYAQLAADAGCAFQPVPADLRQIVAASAAGPGRQAGRRLRALLRDMARYFELAAMVALEAAPGTDAVLFNAVAPYGRDIAEGLRVPSIGMFLQPTEPSAAYPPMATKLASLGGVGNRVAGNLTQLMPASYDTACAKSEENSGWLPRAAAPPNAAAASASWAAVRRPSSSHSEAPPPHRLLPKPPSPPLGRPGNASSSRTQPPTSPAATAASSGAAPSRTPGCSCRRPP